MPKVTNSYGETMEEIADRETNHYVSQIMQGAAYPQELIHRIEMFPKLVEALEKIDRHPYHDVPPPETGAYYSAVTRLNAVLDLVRDTLTEAREGETKSSKRIGAKG